MININPTLSWNVKLMTENIHMALYIGASIIMPINENNNNIIWSLYNKSIYKPYHYERLKPNNNNDEIPENCYFVETFGDVLQINRSGSTQSFKSTYISAK